MGIKAMLLNSRTLKAASALRLLYFSSHSEVPFHTRKWGRAAPLQGKITIIVLIGTE